MYLNKSSTFEVHAHCDGPCGVYDPASARVAAEAVLAMTKKLIALTPPVSYTHLTLPTKRIV